MNTLEIIKLARGLITPREKWTKDSFSRDINGKFVEPESSHAVCWCAAGAVYRFTQDFCEGGHECSEVVYEINKDNDTPIEHINDVYGHAAVLAAFDKTIARLEAEQGN